MNYDLSFTNVLNSHQIQRGTVSEAHVSNVVRGRCFLNTIT